MIAETKVGPQVLTDGSQVTARGSRDGSTITQDSHGRYQEAVLRGNVFTAALQSSTAVTNLATTATGLILSNPAGSGKNLVIISLQVAQSAAAAAAIDELFLAANVNPVAAATVHTTPLTVRNALLGAGGVAAGLADSAATLPVAPVIVRVLAAPSVSATATTAVPPVMDFEFAGQICVAPGCTISLSAPSAFSVFASITWEEVAV